MPTPDRRTAAVRSHSLGSSGSPQSLRRSLPQLRHSGNTLRTALLERIVGAHRLSTSRHGFISSTRLTHSANVFPIETPYLQHSAAIGQRSELRIDSTHALSYTRRP